MTPPRRRFDIQGHRGARGLFAENTCEGFAASLALGVDAMELDVAMTADDAVVVCHDPALHPDIARGADGAWLSGRGPLIRSLSWAELAAYDVGRIRPGSRYRAAFPHQRAFDGARVPLLADVLRLDERARLTIELKTFPDHPDWTADPIAMARATLAVVDAAGAVSRVMLESFDWRGLRFLRDARPDLALGWLTRASLGAATRLWWDGTDPADHAGSVPRAVAAEGGKTWLPEFCDLTRALVEEAHALGLGMVAWTVNQVADATRLRHWGVDGVLSDRPDLLMHLR